MAKLIYFRSMGETMGPVTGAQLRQQAVKGIVMPDTMVRIGDEGEWVRASRLTDLFDAEGRPVGPKSTDKLSYDAPPRKERKLRLTPTMVLMIACLLLLLGLVLCLSFVL